VFCVHLLISARKISCEARACRQLIGRCRAIGEPMAW
jgi:hypothetical protein